MGYLRKNTQDAGPSSMRTPLFMIITASFVLTSCGTFLNPRNWFGRSEPAPASAEVEQVNPLIPRTNRGIRLGGGQREAPDTTTPISTITNIRVERVPGGAIIRATGLDPTQGAFNAKLEPADSEENAVDGVLTYRLQRDTTGERAAGSPAAREVTVARHVTDQTLRGVTTIRVEGAQNALQVRR